jgi:hypothetical protein
MGGGADNEDDSVAALKVARDLKFRFIQEAKVEGNVNRFSGDAHLVLMMSVDGKGSGLDLAWRLSRGDLCKGTVYLDVQKVERGCWLLGRLSTYDEFCRKMGVVCSHLIMAENVASMQCVFSKVKQVCKLENEKIEGFDFSPKWLCGDAAGGPRKAIDIEFQKEQKGGRALFRQCEFHFVKNFLQVRNLKDSHVAVLYFQTVGSVSVETGCCTNKRSSLS